jgi:HJR/Mrr/RecB family endonuclease
MKWLRNLIFGKEAILKQETQKDLQARYLSDSLAFTKQQQKIRLSSNQALNIQATKQIDPQVRHLQSTLNFAKQQQQTLRQKHNEHERWQLLYGSLHIDELKKLSGKEFEDYLAVLFKNHGYQVKTTPSTGDYGADLILNKDQHLIAVQAKCYRGSVGVSAVQEALSGMAYYSCHSAWVVTTGNYTVNAIELARQSKVKLLDSHELGKLIVQTQKPTSNEHE